MSIQHAIDSLNSFYNWCASLLDSLVMSLMYLLGVIVYTSGKVVLVAFIHTVIFRVALIFVDAIASGGRYHTFD